MFRFSRQASAILNISSGRAMSELSKNANIVQKYLIAKGVDCKVVELSESTRTSIEAAKTIGCEVDQIVKSLMFKTKDTNRPVLVLASGSNRVNERIIAKHISEAIVKADADFTRDVTGFAIGGIPPVAHKQPIDLVFIDQDLLNYPVIWAAAGTPFAVFSLQSKELQALTNGKLIAVKTAPTKKPAI